MVGYPLENNMFVNPILKCKILNGYSWEDMTELTGMSRSHVQRTASKKAHEFRGIQMGTILHLEDALEIPVYKPVTDYLRTGKM